MASLRSRVGGGSEDSGRVVRWHYSLELSSTPANSVIVVYFSETAVGKMPTLAAVAHTGTMKSDISFRKCKKIASPLRYTDCGYKRDIGRVCYVRASGHAFMTTATLLGLQNLLSMLSVQILAFNFAELFLTHHSGDVLLISP